MIEYVKKAIHKYIIKPKIKILLITNIDSDNCGDQVIEACDISLIRLVMKNLKIKYFDYSIVSRPLGIVPHKYIQTKDEKLLKNAKNTIDGSDIIIFGGAPVFNYNGQNFYEQTSTIIEIANQKNIPVIISAVGIESYDENNEKCQRLKNALNLPCVKQITTRDGFEYLKKYKKRKDLIIDKVSDPAFFTNRVYKRFVSDKRNKVGIFVFRKNGFIDNNIDFTKEEQAKLWLDLVKEFEKEKIDYMFMSNGHYRDEVFIDYLIREYGIPENKCEFNMNNSEKFVNCISKCDTIISCRLHPSIVAYSLDIPSIGLKWNPKVQSFYENIGYKERILDVKEIDAKKIINEIKNIKNQKIEKNEEDAYQTYITLFNGIKSILKPTSKKLPYKMSIILRKISTHTKIIKRDQERRLYNKFRRIYKELNKK